MADIRHGDARKCQKDRQNALAHAFARRNARPRAIVVKVRSGFASGIA
jgi:hypothetical protein